NKVYEIGYRHALEMIKRNGGQVDGQDATVAVQTPKAVRFEKSFDGLYPLEVVAVNQNLESEYIFEFEGTGVVLKGGAHKESNTLPDHTFELELLIDGQKVEQFRMPTNYTTRKHEIFWRYQLPKGKHTVKVVI